MASGATAEGQASGCWCSVIRSIRPSHPPPPFPATLTHARRGMIQASALAFRIDPDRSGEHEIRRLGLQEKFRERSAFKRCEWQENGKR